MNSIAFRVAIALVAVTAFSTQRINQKQAPSKGGLVVSAAVDKGARWLASVQGADGGWGQDGTNTTYSVQNHGAPESQGNDVANTAVAALALLKAGNEYRPNVERAVAFILERIERSPQNGLAVTDQQGTQIQRKLGPYIDTFLASMLLSRVDGTMAKAQNLRIRRGLEKCVAKIETNQKNDGSWNIDGGWAPVLGTSLASRSLYEAQKKGVRVSDKVLARADQYAKDSVNQTKAPSTGYGSGGASGFGYGRGTPMAGMGPGRGGGTGAGSTADGVISSSESVAVAAPATELAAASAGVNLYQSAQAMEQLSRTEELRTKNRKEIDSINRQLSDEKFVAGFGSIGGEEFFSYLNMSDGLKRAGGKAWAGWHTKITDKILKLQNNDGTWVGHHCITGRVAVTSAAILNLTVNGAI